MKINLVRRRLLFGIFAAAVALVVGASAAYACVPLRGDGQVSVAGSSGDGTAPQNSGTFTGFNGSDPLEYCESGDTAGPGWDSNAEAQADGGDVITVTVNASTDSNCPAPGNRLDEGTYSVIVNNATVASASPFTLVNNGTTNVWSIVRTTGCFTSATPNGNITLDTAFEVDATGSGSSVYTLPTMNRVDGPNAASSVCVGRATGGVDPAQGIFVPMIIEAVI